jgi:hypothetical protein
VIESERIPLQDKDTTGPSLRYLKEIVPERFPTVASNPFLDRWPRRASRGYACRREILSRRGVAERCRPQRLVTISRTGWPNTNGPGT